MRFTKRAFFNLTILIISGILLFGCSKNETKETVVVKRTISSEREAFLSNLIENTIEKPLAKELTDSTEESWKGAFWAMQLAQYKTSKIDSSIQDALQNLTKYSVSMQRALLEVVFSKYQNVFIDEVREAIEGINNEKVFAMAAEYLLEYDKGQNDFVLNLIKTNFPKWEHHPILSMLDRKIKNINEHQTISLPNVSDLLTHMMGSDKFIVYSFLRANRDYIGLTIFKNADGSLLKDASGNILAVPQFARSVTNLPSYLTNGNTPQGIYAITGFDISDNVFIGPTQNVQTKMPYEVNLNDFMFDSTNNSEWTLDSYQSLLPDSWKDYLPIYETFFAGQAGRSEIIAHGTTINPEFYRAYSFYPYTPSLGCMTTKEIWSDTTGELIESDQQKLIAALKSLNSLQGYWIVVELDDKNENVTLDEVENLIHN